MIEGENKLTDQMISALKQGTKVEFKWHGSDLLYYGRIERMDNGSLFFINEHCFEDDKLMPHNEPLRYYNRLDSFFFFTYFKIIE